MGAGGKIFGALLLTKVPFLVPNIKHLPKFLEYALPWNFNMLSFPCLMLDFYLVPFFAHYSIAALESIF